MMSTWQCRQVLRHTGVTIADSRTGDLPRDLPPDAYPRRLRKQKEKSLTLNQIPHGSTLAAVSKKSVSGGRHPVVVQGAKGLQLVGDALRFTLCFQRFGTAELLTRDDHQQIKLICARHNKRIIVQRYKLIYTRRIKQTWETLFMPTPSQKFAHR